MAMHPFSALVSKPSRRNFLSISLGAIVLLPGRFRKKKADAKQHVIVDGWVLPSKDIDPSRLTSRTQSVKR